MQQLTMTKSWALLFTSLLLVMKASAELPEAEVVALQTLYEQCNGEGWFRQSGWNEGNTSNACSWEGVQCDSSNNHVISLSFLSSRGLETRCGTPNPYGDGTATCLIGNNLQCSSGLPQQLCNLTKLTALDLSMNNIGGSLPNCLNTMIELRYLALGESAIGGEIPDLSSLQALESLNLGDSCGVYTATQIAILTSFGIVYDYELWGGPFYSNLYACEYYVFHTYPTRNHLSGSIPSWLSSLPNLTYINLRANDLTGPLPERSSLPPLLKELLVGQNALTGPVPASLVAIPSLKNFNIDTNTLSGPLPTDWSGLTSIRFITISRNGFTGPLPSSIGSLATLENIWVVNVPVQGPIPPEIGNCLKLRALVLMVTSLSGPIPASIGNLKYLAGLGLANSFYEGALPAEIAGLSELRELDLSASFLQGDFSLFTGMPYLRRLELKFNRISGSIPANIHELMPGLTYINAQSNLLTGTIPSTLANISNLFYIDLRNNRLTGSIPPALANLRLLQNLGLSGNALQGPIPPAIWYCPLSTLLLAENAFTGPLAIPSTALAVWTLQVLDISRNSLSGPLPQSLALASALQEVRANDNLFTGEIPASWESLTALKYLDLSSNNLSCSIEAIFLPLRRLPNLQFLAVSSNRIFGVYNQPHLFRDHISIFWPALKQLRLANNSIQGQIAFFSFPPVILEMDLSSNQLSGSFDIYSSTLTSLNLRGNPGLQSPDEALPSQVRPEDNYVLDSTGLFTCPILSGIDRAITLSVEATYYNRSLCNCTRGFFGSKGQCRPCLQGGRCDGGASGSFMIISEGYAPSPSIDNLQGLVPCKLDRYGRSACNPNSNRTWSCSAGHYERLCSRCLPGYFESQVLCVACPAVLPVVLLVVIGGGLVAFFFYRVFVSAYESSDVGTQFRITISYLQMLQTLFSMDVVVGNVGLFDKIQFVSGPLSFNLSMLQCVSHEFFSPSVTFNIFFLLLPAFALLALPVVAVTFMLRRRHLNELINGVCRGLISVALLIYLPLTFKVTEVFDCVTDPYSGRRYLASAPFFECSGPEYTRLLAMSVTGLAVYTLGIPVVVCLLMYRLHHRSAFALQTLGPSIASYRDKWYILAQIFRALALGILSNFLGRSNLLAPCLVQLVLFASAFIVLYFMPFLNASHNLSEILAIAAVAFSLTCGLARAHLGGMADVVDYLLLLSNVLVGAVLVAFLLAKLATPVAKKVASSPLPFYRRSSKNMSSKAMSTPNSTSKLNRSFSHSRSFFTKHSNGSIPNEVVISVTTTAAASPPAPAVVYLDPPTHYVLDNGTPTLSPPALASVPPPVEHISLDHGHVRSDSEWELGRERSDKRRRQRSSSRSRQRTPAAVAVEMDGDEGSGVADGSRHLVKGEDRRSPDVIAVL